MSDFYSCDMPRAYREITRKARKEHRCCECNLVIPAGDTYQYISGIWDGSPDSYKTCMNCVYVRNVFTSLPENDTAIIGGLREEISGSFCRDFGIREYSESSGISVDRLNRLFGV